MAEAFRHRNLRLMDYYRMTNVQAETAMREAIATTEAGPSAAPKTSRGR